MLSSSFISMQLVTQVVNLNWTSLYTDKKSEKEIALCRLSLTQGELENFVYLYKSYWRCSWFGFPGNSLSMPEVWLYEQWTPWIYWSIERCNQFVTFLEHWMPLISILRLREACFFQYRWVFEKFPNGLWPPPAPFSEKNIAIFFPNRTKPHQICNEIF